MWRLRKDYESIDSYLGICLQLEMEKYRYQKYWGYLSLFPPPQCQKILNIVFSLMLENPWKTTAVFFYKTSCNVKPFKVSQKPS